MLDEEDLPDKSILGNCRFPLRVLYNIKYKILFNVKFLELIILSYFLIQCRIHGQIFIFKIIRSKALALQYLDHECLSQHHTLGEVD